MCECADEAWRLGINPDGQVKAVYVDIKRVPAEFRNRLLTRDEEVALSAKL